MSLLNLTRCQTGCNDIDPSRKFAETVVAPSDLNRIAEEQLRVRLSATITDNFGAITVAETSKQESKLDDESRNSQFKKPGNALGKECSVSSIEKLTENDLRQSIQEIKS